MTQSYVSRTIVSTIDMVSVDSDHPDGGVDPWPSTAPCGVDPLTLRTPRHWAVHRPENWAETDSAGSFPV